MRIAIVMSLMSPWCREVARQLKGAGLQVHLVNLKHEEHSSGYLDSSYGIQQASIVALTEIVDGVHFIRAPFGVKASYPLAAYRLRSEMQRIGAQLVLVLYAGWDSALVYLTGFRPYVVYTVGSDILLTNWCKRPVLRKVLKNAARVYANGSYLLSCAKELVPDVDIRMLLLGVDTSRFTPGEATPEPVRIICTRGFDRVYNNDCIIRALQYMSNEFSNFEMIFTSPGPLLESSKKLADEILSPNIRARIYFLGGVSSEKLIVLLRASHIYISMSISDGTSTSLLEALACGLFPILSDIPQNREWVSPEWRNGTLVPSGNPEVLATVLESRIRNIQEASTVVTYNRKLIIDRADSRRNMAILASDFESIIFETKR